MLVNVVMLGVVVSIHSQYKVDKLPMIAYIYHGPGWKDTNLHPLVSKQASL